MGKGERKDDPNIYYYDIRRPLTQAELNTVSAIRRKKAAAFKKEADAMRCLAAGFLVAKYIKTDESLFVCNSYGKPGLPDDLNPNSLYFNLTHSKNLVALVIADREVGIDIEPAQRQGKALLNRVFTDAEIQMINNGESFARLWTMKEAVMKASGKGLTLDPKTFHVTKDVVFADEKHWRLESFIYEGYAVSTAIECNVSESDVF